MRELECLRVPSCNGTCDKPGCPYRLDMSPVVAMPERDVLLPPDMLGTCLKAISGLLGVIPDQNLGVEANAAVIFGECVKTNLIQIGVKHD